MTDSRYYWLLNRICTAAFCLLVSLNSYADSGFKGGFNLWSQDLTGSVEFEGDSADTEDFGINDPQESIKLYFETRRLFPFYPDFRFYYDSFRYEGQTSEIYDYGGEPFAEGARVVIGSQTFGLTTFYRKTFTDFFEGAAGLDVRNVSFDITVSGFNASDKRDIEVTFSGTKELVSFIPMIFVKGSLKLPNTGFYGYAEGNYAKLEDNVLADYRGALGTEVFWNINMEAGYRSLVYLVRNGTKDIDVNLSVSGTFIELNYEF